MGNPLIDGFAKTGFVDCGVAAAVKIGNCPVLDGAFQTPCFDKVITVIGRHHGKGLIAHPRSKNSVTRAAIFSRRYLGHRLLLSDD